MKSGNGSGVPIPQLELTCAAADVRMSGMQLVAASPMPTAERRQRPSKSRPGPERDGDRSYSAKWCSSHLRESVMGMSIGCDKHREPWNKRKHIGQKAILKLKEIWRFGSGSSSPVAQESLRCCSTWIASATGNPSQQAQTSCSKKHSVNYSLRSPNIPAKALPRDPRRPT